MSGLQCLAVYRSRVWQATFEMGWSRSGKPALPHLNSDESAPRAASPDQKGQVARAGSFFDARVSISKPFAGVPLAGKRINHGSCDLVVPGLWKENEPVAVKDQNNQTGIAMKRSCHSSDCGCDSQSTAASPLQHTPLSRRGLLQVGAAGALGGRSGSARSSAGAV